MLRVHAARAQVVPAQEAVYRATLQLEAAQQAVPSHPAAIAAATQRLEEAKETAKQVYIQYNNEVVESKRMGLIYRVRDLEYESGRLAGLPSEATRNAVQYMKNVRDQPGMSPRLHMPPLLGMSARDFNDYTEKMADRLHQISAANREEAREAERRRRRMRDAPEAAAELHLQPGLGGASMRRMKVKHTRSKKRHASTRKHSKKYAYSRKRIHRRKY
jgi:hypothetical protein